MCSTGGTSAAYLYYHTHSFHSCDCLLSKLPGTLLFFKENKTLEELAESLDALQENVSSPLRALNGALESLELSLSDWRSNVTVNQTTEFVHVSFMRRQMCGATVRAQTRRPAACCAHTQQQQTPIGFSFCLCLSFAPFSLSPSPVPLVLLFPSSPPLPGSRRVPVPTRDFP